MTIKKTKATSAGKPAAPGGAAIADRFKLDSLDEHAGKTAIVGRKSALCALIAGLLSLAVAGVLTFVLWKHWEFLMPA